MSEVHPPTVLFIVPYKARDLEGVGAVAYHLERKWGIKSILSNGYELETKIRVHAPDILVLDHLAWDFKVRQAKDAKGLGIKVAVLPTEGLFQDQEGAVRRAGKLHNGTRVPDLYMVWGDFPRRAILEEQLMDPERLVVVGCPRFDYYAPEWRGFSVDRQTFCARLGIKNWRAPLVLWATNTPYATRSVRKMLWRQTRRAKKPKAEVLEHIQDHLIQNRLHTEAVTKLAEKHPEWNFVVKVHPAEWVNPYISLQERFANVSVAYNAPIREFLIHSDVLLQRNCTTATEAWVLEKPVINMDIGELRRPVRQEYLRCMDSATSVDQVESLIIDYLNGREIPSEQKAAREEFIRDFFGAVDGQSAEKAADALQSLVDDEESRKRRRKLIAEARRTQREEEDRRFTNRVKDLLGVPRDRSLRFWRRWFTFEQKGNLGLFEAETEISAGEVEVLFRRLDSIHCPTS